MLPNADSASAATASSTAPQPPQRQSCDRCHRQKLRCTRNKSASANGDACDRCLSKRAHCVYSSSLPKGRPSLRRLTADPPAAPKKQPVDDAPSSATEASRPPSQGLPISISTPTSITASTTTAAAPMILPLLKDATPMDLTMCTTWPWNGPTGWEETQSDMSWDSVNFSRSDMEDLLTSTNTNSFDGEGSIREDSDTFSLAHSSTSSPPNPPPYTFTQPGLGSYERQDTSGAMAHLEKSLGGSAITMFPDKSASVVIGQLSQLSVHLSSLRSLTYTMVQVADSSFGGRGAMLLDSASFESVAAWLAYEETFSHMNPRRSVHLSTDGPSPWPNPGPQIQPQSGPNILRDVFSASHHLMEIVRHLQADDIIRHLVMACEALLLEIYAAILTALQHEAYPDDSLNATALGNIRLVLIVQLCAYLIERQNQVVGQCLAPVMVAQQHSLPNSLPSNPFHLGAADRESLKDLKAQIQQKLTSLRQMLQCT